MSEQEALKNMRYHSILYNGALAGGMVTIQVALITIQVAW